MQIINGKIATICSHFKDGTGISRAQFITQMGYLMDHSISRFFVYYSYFKIIGDPCNLIGSQRCDLFTNHTTFLSPNHIPLAHESKMKYSNNDHLKNGFLEADQ